MLSNKRKKEKKKKMSSKPSEEPRCVNVRPFDP